jgi:predicted DNA binding CopG/RHH family protein
MIKIPKDPFDGLILDEEEQAIENSLEVYKSTPDFDISKKLIEDAAKQYKYLNTTKPITLRVKQVDLIKIKAKAKRNSIPYQTLLSAAIHDIAEDKRDLIIK